MDHIPPDAFKPFRHLSLKQIRFVMILDRIEYYRNKTKAAITLGLTRSTLRYYTNKIKAKGLIEAATKHPIKSRND